MGERGARLALAWEVKHKKWKEADVSWSGCNLLSSLMFEKHLLSEERLEISSAQNLNLATWSVTLRLGLIIH